ncbi:MAG: hypothetical protein ACFFD7_04620 [Candidatus Thorarchaeota archaeon]
MTENQAFNLEKIKELTSSIDLLQAKAYQLKEESLKVDLWKNSIKENISEEKFLSQIDIISRMLDDIRNILQRITKETIGKFLYFQEGLIRKYKENYQYKLKKLRLNEKTLRRIGIYLIENRKINKFIHEISYTPSLSISQWLDILDSLQENSLFLKIMKKIKTYREGLIQRKLNIEISKIPKDTEASLIEEYKKAFFDDPELSFKDFIQIIENNLTQQELKEKRLVIKEAKEKEELEELKKKQEEHKETYEDYFKLSESEFKRKRRKKSREKLTSIKKESKKSKRIQVSDEISEKIEKFKSKLDKTFNEKYLIQKDDEKDPLDLVRERKRKKEKEYRQYKDHFD